MTACGEPDNGLTNGQSARIECSVNELVFPAAGGEQTFDVSCDREWTAYGEAEWIRCDVTGSTEKQGSVKVTVQEHSSTKARSSSVIVKSGTSRTVITVSQEGEKEGEIVVPEGYRLVWQDEFNDPSLIMPDGNKWWYETAEPGWVNNELQTYVPGRRNDIITAEVSDGTLKIRVIKEGDRIYSARVNTREAWTYGYFEARLKLPEGKGTWPAFWMMPKSGGSWPKCGEIDIMEHVGCVPTEVSSSIHCMAYYHAINTQKTAARKIATVMDEFHTYALEWTSEYIKTYVDGVLLFHYNPDDYPKGRNGDTWPFDKAFQLKLNLAWGGDWGGMYGVDESCLPATYEIDYVRVFQK